MSIEAINWALKTETGSPGCKLVLIVLANYANEDGESYPSHATLSARTEQCVKTVSSHLRRLEDSGLLVTVPRYGTDGRRTSNIYRLNIGASLPAKITDTPHVKITDTPPVKITEYPLEKKPSEKPSDNACASGKPKRTKQDVTFTDYRKQLQQQGEKFLPDDDPLFAWAESVALPDGYISLAWLEFKSRHATDAKKQKDWRAVFRRAVREDWLKLWAIGRDGEYYLTTKGKMIERERDAARN